MVPLRGPLLGCHCYPCVSVAVMSASSLLCCLTATLMLTRNPKCDIKSELPTCVDIQSTCRIFRICNTLQDLQLSVCLSLPGFISKKLQQQNCLNVSAATWQTVCAKSVSKKRSPWGSGTVVSVCMGEKSSPEVVIEPLNCCSVRTGNAVWQTQGSCYI